MESSHKKIYDRLPIFAQNILVSCFSGILDRQRYGGSFAANKAFLENSQWFSEQHMLDYQHEKLSRLIAYCYRHVKYYRRVMDERGLKPSDIQTIDDLKKMPILTKRDIKNHFQELFSDQCDMKSAIKGHTSGTTGSPLEVGYSKELVSMTYALLDRQYAWAGVSLKRFGDRVAIARGNVIVPLQQKRPPFWRYNYFHNHLLLSSFHLAPATIGHYIDELEKFRPVALDGYPSTVYLLAKYLQNNKKKMKLSAVLTSSETLFDFQRAVIEDSFQCDIFDYFGSAERVFFATECEKHEGHHVAAEYGITEIVDSNFSPVKPGQVGKVVATSLHNTVMPMIRYLTNDMTALKEQACSCGRGLPLMEDVTTKAEDILTLRDGRLISPSVLTHPFKPLTSIEASQIIQEDLDSICVKLVVGPDFVASDEKILVHGLQERLGQDVRIRIEIVDELERTRSGKFKWVVSHVNLGI